MSSLSPYKIPIVDLRAQYGNISAEVRHAIDQVFETQQFILGPAVTGFEEQMAGYLGCDHAVGVASGSDALLLALMALGIGPGDGVIVTPFTFFSTVSSITRLGATPLFVDIDAESFLLSAPGVRNFLAERGRIHDHQTLDSKTGVKIKALLPVHLYGRCCNMAEFAAIACQYHVEIVEDVAQACGARTGIESQEIFAGNIGALGCFSFFPSKNLGGFGDGGLVTTNSKELTDKLRMLRMHGERTKYYHQVTGINSRLDSIQAAVLAVKLRYLDEWCARRVQRADTYHRLFTAQGLVGNEVISIPVPATDRSHVFNNYVVRVQHRDQLRRFLAEQGIQTEVYYPVPLHLQECFTALRHGKGDFPQAERAAKEVLALPIYPELSDEQQEFVITKIGHFYRR